MVRWDGKDQSTDFSTIDECSGASDVLGSASSRVSIPVALPFGSEEKQICLRKHDLVEVHKPLLKSSDVHHITYQKSGS